MANAFSAGFETEVIGHLGIQDDLQDLPGQLGEQPVRANQGQPPVPGPG